MITVGKKRPSNEMIQLEGARKQPTISRQALLPSLTLLAILLAMYSAVSLGLEVNRQRSDKTNMKT